LFPCIEWGNEQMAKQNGLDSSDCKSIDFKYSGTFEGEEKKRKTKGL
jgi:hypothetical protein